MNVDGFRATVQKHYSAKKRSMPWRADVSPYVVLVSEIMLQQTQVSRVIPKFEQFMAAFPNIEVLAAAPFSEVLHSWSGLGYNRRAKFLHQTAQLIATKHGGIVPRNRKELESLPGIGPNTAGSILVYAYNVPETFIETNIRSVYLHHFFGGKHNVDDKEIMKLIARDVPDENPREWYWALMDYGSWLKKHHPNPSRASKHHTTQSKFEGSTRQLRGKILHALIEKKHSKGELEMKIQDARLPIALDALQKEQLVTFSENIISLR